MRQRTIKKIVNEINSKERRLARRLAVSSFLGSEIAGTDVAHLVISYIRFNQPKLDYQESTAQPEYSS